VTGPVQRAASPGAASGARAVAVHAQIIIEPSKPRIVECFMKVRSFVRSAGQVRSDESR
jgi:hypothetical protein